MIATDIPQPLLYADVVAEPKIDKSSQNFRATLPLSLRTDLSDWETRIGTTDKEVGIRLVGWFLSLPLELQIRIWGNWQLPPDSEMAKAILASLKPREADGERKIVSLTTPASLTPSSLRAPAPPLPTYTKGKSK